MPASQSASTARRPIQRFDLASINIDGRPNTYKNPQLVLKPQLEHAPRRPYTGSRPRVPLWRHFLMVHVRDKADELVKLDLVALFGPSVENDQVSGNVIVCLLSRSCLIFQHAKDAGSAPSALSVTFQKASDLEIVLRELHDLGLNVEHEQTTQEDRLMASPTVFKTWVPVAHADSPLYRPASNPRHLNSASPPLIAVPGSEGRFVTYRSSQQHGAVLQRPPSQPAGQTGGLQPGQRPWSPAVVPSRPATTLGLPGILGEGIYKVSKVDSTRRPRVRRTATILEQQAPQLYTVSRHFDKTVGQTDIAFSSGGHYPSRMLSTGSRIGSSAEYLSGSTGPGVQKIGNRHIPLLARPSTQPATQTSSALEGSLENAQQPRPKRLRTVGTVLDANLTAGSYRKGRAPFLPSVTEHAFEPQMLQPKPPRAAGADDVLLPSSSPTLLDPQITPEMQDALLLQLCQAQHLGLHEAGKIWDEFMERAVTEVEAAEITEDLPEVLSKFEGEFARRWERVVANTMQKMRSLQAGSHGL